MDNIKLLVCDDDNNICELLRLYLVKEGYSVVLAQSGNEALSLFHREHPDMVLLDIMMPGMDGWQVCREIRKTSDCPIIMITAKGETFDKVLGLELGADDYVVKPFDTKEVVARIKAVLRRVQVQTGGSDIKEVSYDNLTVNLTNYELKIKGKLVDAPPKELELLYHMASNPGKVYTRNQLLDEVWGFDYFGDSRTIDVHIKRLREKLDGVSDKWDLKTVWGVGINLKCWARLGRRPPDAAPQARTRPALRAGTTCAGPAGALPCGNDRLAAACGAPLKHTKEHEMWENAVQSV